MKKWLVCFVLMVVMLLSVSGVYAKEMATLHFNSLEEYEQYFSSLEKKPYVIYYDDISEFGEFDFYSGPFMIHFATLKNPFAEGYSYSLIDASGYRLRIQVFHTVKPDLDAREAKYIKGKLTTENDLRKCLDTRNSDLELDGFHYCYAGGRLHYVYWFENGHRIEIGGTAFLDDYPNTTDTLVGKLLNSETAPEAIQTIKDMKITEGLPKGTADFGRTPGFFLKTVIRDAVIVAGMIALAAIITRVRTIILRKKAVKSYRSADSRI